MRKSLIILSICMLLLSACNNESSKDNINEADDPIIDNEIIVEEAEVNESNQTSLTEGYKASFNWQDENIVGVPQNQDPYGTCAIFAVMSIFESSIARSTGELVNLSEQHFINNTDDWKNDSGVSPEKVLSFIVDNGVVLEEILPYTGIKENVPLDPEFDYKLSSWGSALLKGYPLDERIEIVKRNLKEHGPIITNIALYDDLNNYTSGIYEADESSGVKGGHWLTILGWVDDELITNGGYWICKNSWGRKWGDGGFLKIVYGDISGIDDYILYYVDELLENPTEANNDEGNELVLEASYDLRDSDVLNDPKDQLESNSDMVFAATGLLESSIARRMKVNPDLSEQYFIDHSKYWNDDNIVAPEMVLNFLVDTGTVLEETSPYTGVKSTMMDDSKSDYMLASWDKIHLDAYGFEKRVKAIKESIIKYGPVMTNIGIREDFTTYSEGVLISDDTLNLTEVHWITIVGWVDDASITNGGYWICKNSWGTEWGEGGYCKIIYDDVSGIDKYSLYYVTTPILTCISETEFPAYFNWQDKNIVSVPKDQESLGTCAVYAATSAFESYLAITIGELLDLSEQQYIMSSDSWSPDAGMNPGTIMDFYSENGVVTEKKLPYSVEDALNKTESKEYGFDYKFNSTLGVEALSEKTLEERTDLIKYNVMHNGPIITAITFYKDFDVYQGGIYEYDDASECLGGHWINIIGWQDDDSIESGGYWICKNSFGTEWGENGFCKIAYNDPCGVDQFVIYYINMLQTNDG